MNSVERLKYYIENTDQEEPQAGSAALASVSVPDAWPDQGVVALKDVRFGYRDGPDVITGLSFETTPHEKIGVVGRTG